MNILSLVAAKQHSTRLPSKNFASVDGLALYQWGLKALEPFDPWLVCDWKTFHMRSVFRPKHIAQDDQPLIMVFEYAYRILNSNADVVATVMANCPGHKPEDVQKAINILIEYNLLEVRSYNENGVENGIWVFRPEIFKAKRVSAYVGAITVPGVYEIHTKKDLELCRLLLQK